MSEKLQLVMKCRECGQEFFEYIADKNLYKCLTCGTISDLLQMEINKKIV